MLKTGLVYTSFIRALRDMAANVWNGPGDLSRPLRLEWRIVLGRWLGISVVGLSLTLRAEPISQLALAYAVLVAGFAYTLVLMYLIRRRPSVVSSGAVPTIGDGVLCALMLPIVGGFESSFYAILYLVMIAAGIRLGFFPGMFLAMSVGLLDAIGMVSAGGPIDAAYTIRTGVLLGTVLITSFLYEEAQKAEAELATRLEESQTLNSALQHQALHDLLTDLPNRTLLRQRLEQSIPDGKLALLVIDLDRFQDINDTFGHQYGDVLLRKTGTRLVECLGPAATVARLGGDEFAVLLPDADEQYAERVAAQLHTALTQTFTIADYVVEVGGSIGIAASPLHGADPDTLLRRADVAMYSAKRSGRGFAMYAADQDQHSPERLALITDLRRAIEGDELTLWYQPQVSLKSGRCVGVEALIRWSHPQLGWIAPDRFIPLAEQTGLIKGLSRWVLDAALRQAHTWQLEGIDMPISVNLSMRDLHDPDLPSTVAELLKRWDACPRRLMVEITENGLMADPARALQTVIGLRALGLRIAIDDFGTGYSSLAYLKRLPVDELKIDRSFVRDLSADADDRAIVHSIVGLGHDLGLNVIAEGIEDAETLTLLRELGCDVAQGYYTGRPAPAEMISTSIQAVSIAA
jgi:diguanylate cyclase (GGDEF)-like protein